MIKVYCQDCGTQIKNVEDWLLAATPEMWKCRDCFYNLKTYTQLLVTEGVSEKVEAAA